VKPTPWRKTAKGRWGLWRVEEKLWSKYRPDCIRADGAVFVVDCCVLWQALAALTQFVSHQSIRTISYEYRPVCRLNSFSIRGNCVKSLRDSSATHTEPIGWQWTVVLRPCFVLMFDRANHYVSLTAQHRGQRPVPQLAQLSSNRFMAP